VSSESNDYWVYIVTNNTRSTLYIGITSDLRVRIWQHRVGDRPGTFSQRYHCSHLVYYEHFREVRNAIAREKQLKGCATPEIGHADRDPESSVGRSRRGLV
jgi:putative endonuclease